MEPIYTEKALLKTTMCIVLTREYAERTSKSKTSLDFKETREDLVHAGRNVPC